MQERLAQRIEAIASEQRRGGSWLARQAVETIVEASELGADPLEVGRQLVAARPGVGAIAGALGRLLAAGRTHEQLVEEAQALIAGRDRAAKSIAVLLSPDLRGVVMTHSESATVREALLHTPPDRVVCTVSEPLGEGRAFAQDLRAAGLSADVVPDEDATRALGSADLLLVGADTVFRDGTLVNKSGTHKLAEAATSVNVPVVVACEVIKLAPTTAPDRLEERFDVTPPQCIDRFVTEEGAFGPAEVASLVDRTPFLVEGYKLLQAGLN